MAASHSTANVRARKRLDVNAELARLQDMSQRDLRAEYAELFEEESRSRNKQWLIKRIIWRIQANAFGGLSDRARLRAAEIANDADLRMKAPTNMPVVEEVPGVPNAGNVLTREYKGQLIEVTVLNKGFSWNGQAYRSLSAVAKAITGSNWNGYHFFGLKKKGAAK